MSSLVDLPPLPSHGFHELIKGEHFAYAKGLAVNPTHLPLVLDRMLADGWEFMNCFGETTSQHIGFIFRKIS